MRYRPALIAALSWMASLPAALVAQEEIRPAAQSPPRTVIVADREAAWVQQFVRELEAADINSEVHPPGTEPQSAESRLDVQFSVRHDEPHRNVAKLIEELAALRVPRLRFALATTDEHNQATILAGSGVPQRDLTAVLKHLSEQKHVPLHLRVEVHEPGPGGSASVSEFAQPAANRDSQDPPTGGDGLLGATFPGGGFGEGQSQFPSGAPTPLYVSSDKLIVAWSEDKSTAWGFSTPIGNWTKQMLDPPMDQYPVVGSSTAAIHAGSKVYAFSGVTGTWDVLQLPGETKLNASVGDDLVLVTSGRSVYTFAAATGRWTSPDGAAVKPDQERRLFELKRRISRDELDRLIKDLGVPDGNFTMTNLGLTVHASPASMQRIAEALRAFDAGGPSSADPGRAPGDLSPASASRTAGLRDRYRQAEARASELARQIRALGADAPASARLKSDLRSAVTESFRARQELQQAELAEFRARMDRIRQSIDDRERVADEVIQRRVDDLLDPAGWDSGGTTLPANDPASNPFGSARSTNQTTRPESVTQTGTAPTRTRESSLAPLQPVQLWFKSPVGAQVRWPFDTDTSDNTAALRDVVVPARLPATTGNSVLFPLSHIPGHEGLEISGSIELAPATPLVATFARHSAIPIEIAIEDVEQAAGGNLVTKVVFLPHPENAESASAGVESLVTTRLDPGVDPVAEARRRGDIIAILRLGNRD